MAQEALFDRINLHASDEEDEFSGFSDQDKKEKKSSDKKRLKSIVVDKNNNKKLTKG